MIRHKGLHKVIHHFISILTVCAADAHAELSGQYRCLSHTDGASGTTLINSCLNLLRTQEHTLFKFKKKEIWSKKWK